MGHHLFIHHQKSLPIRDPDVALVKHFLIKGAKRINDESLRKAIAKWEYQGTGVWIGVDVTVLVDRDGVFAAAIDIAESFGETIPLNYLNEHVGFAGLLWLKEQSTSHVTALIRSLEEHLRAPNTPNEP